MQTRWPSEPASAVQSLREMWQPDPAEQLSLRMLAGQGHNHWASGLTPTRVGV